ncbi:MAG: hypothetical protein U0X40_07210 [Ferruginibacter sp.]
MKLFILTLLLSVLFASCGTNPEWTSLGPAVGGRLSAIVASPTDPNTLVVATPGGGIWRTSNNGINWVKPLGYSLADYAVVDLQWDRIRSGRLLASTMSDVYASTDLGDHWENLTHSGGYPAALFRDFALTVPKPFAQLRYSATASTIFWSRPGSGIYYSNDGSNFIQLPMFAGGSNNPDNFITSICADDLTGYVYFSTFFLESAVPGHIYRSTAPWTAATPCLTFELVNNGLPVRSQILGIAWSGIANKLVMVLNSLDEGLTSAVYTTTNGTNWAICPAQPVGNQWDPRPLVCPAPNQIILGTVVPYVSNDWGQSWNPLWYSNLHPDIRNFYWGAYSSGSYLWMVTDGAEACSCYGNISRWNFTPGNTPTGGTNIPVNGMKAWQCHYAAVTGTIAGSRRRIFVGAMDNGGFVSDDNGATWVSAGAPNGIGCGDLVSLVFAPSNPNRAYARSCSGSSLQKTDNALSAPTPGAISWTVVTPAGGNYLPEVWTNNITAVDPADADRVCIARAVDIAISTNAGTNWEAHTLPGNAKALSVSLDAGTTVYVGTIDSGIFKSTDNGAHWTVFGLNNNGIRGVLKVVHTSAGGGEGTYFAATTGGLYRKLPGGTFTFMNSGGDANYVVNDIEVDPNCPTRIYIAKGYASIWGLHRGGVLLSTDNGNSFSSITSGLDIHQGPVTDIQVDPVNSQFIYAASYGQSVWRWNAGSVPACQ